MATVEPREYTITPAAAPTATLRVTDERESHSADDDLIEIALETPEVAIGVTLSVDELSDLQQILAAVIAQDLPERSNGD